jgi:hypothetical protein
MNNYYIIEMKTPYNKNNYNYSKIYKGGRKLYNSYYNKKLNLLYKKYKNTAKNNMLSKKAFNNSEKDYNELILPEIKEYTYKFSNNIYNTNIIENIKKYLASDINRNNLITYVLFLNKNVYDKDYISKLVNIKYLRDCAFNIDDMEYDEEYYNKLQLKFIDYNPVYKVPKLDNKIKDIVSYYENIDIQFSNYIKSIHCLLWIIQKYQDILYDIGFKRCNYDKLKRLLTPELKKQLKNEDQYSTENIDSLFDTEMAELECYSEIILSNLDKYRYIYRKIFYTEDWNFTDLGNIIYYIDKYNLDIFTVLNRLSADYSWAMYKADKVEPGIQSTSIMILGDLGYDFDKEMNRTIEVQHMIDEIYSIKADLYFEDFIKSYKTLIKLFKRTIEKELFWGAKIF